MEDPVDLADPVVEASREAGEALARWRAAARLSQTQLASRIGYSRSQVAGAERGSQRTAEGFWRRCDEVLGANRALLTAYSKIDAARQAKQQETARQAEAQREARLERWRAQQGVATAASAALRPDRPVEAPAFPSLLHLVQRAGLDLAEQLTARRDLGRVDHRLVAAHEEITEALAEWYRSVDPRAALPVTMPYADHLLSLLDETMTDRQRADLTRMVVGIHAQIGLWACHARRWSVALRYLPTASEVAAGAGDPHLRARALGALSYLFSSAPRGGHGGDSSRALELLDGALELAVHAEGFTRGWLATWRADQYATLGRLEAACADVAAADQGLGASDDGGVLGYFSRRTYGYGMDGHLNSVRAVVAALSGDVDDADRTFALVQSSAANMRRRVATLGHLGLARSRADDPEAACDALGRSITLAEQAHYPMGLERAVGVRAGFDPRWSTLPRVRDLDEQLRVAAA